MIHKVLIANRGEIAVRIIRASREMGILTVAVYSEADREALHTQLADEAVCIGPAAAKDSYLNMQAIISATIVTGADAIHPGYGFLSENAEFAKLCEDCHIRFIGPTSETMAHLGNKAKARQTMQEAGVPVVPGCDKPLLDVREALEEANRIGYPVIIKAVLGGGGKGMRVAKTHEDFIDAFLTAQKESQMAFGDRQMYLEHYVEDPKHVEVQILADCQGHVIHLGERDCSIQRNHQKMVEEAPALSVSEKTRRRLGKTAVTAAKAAGYTNAGTIEFLMERDEHFYFMEMNTRVQVEHPITECVTGIDIVKEQIRIADGRPLSYRQKDVHFEGCAIECRINAEDPAKHFLPCPGTIKEMYLPGGKGVRIDCAIYNGCEITPYYDSMIGKLIVKAKNRNEAIAKMHSALGEVIIEGVTTNIDYLYHLMEREDYQNGYITTSYMEHVLEDMDQH